MGDVVMFNGDTRLDLPPDRVLEAAAGQLAQCIVIGKTHDGQHWIASSIGDIEKAIYELERAKFVLMSGVP